MKSGRKMSWDRMWTVPAVTNSISWIKSDMDVPTDSVASKGVRA